MPRVCWRDAGPTSAQHWAGVWCVLGPASLACVLYCSQFTSSNQPVQWAEGPRREYLAMLIAQEHAIPHGKDTQYSRPLTIEIRWLKAGCVRSRSLAAGGTLQLPGGLPTEARYYCQFCRRRHSSTTSLADGGRVILSESCRRSLLALPVLPTGKGDTASLADAGRVILSQSCRRRHASIASLTDGGTLALSVLPTEEVWYLRSIAVGGLPSEALQSPLACVSQ